MKTPDLKKLFTREKKDPLIYTIRPERDWFAMLGLFSILLVALFVGNSLAGTLFSAQDEVSLEGSSNPEVPRINKVLLEKTARRFVPDSVDPEVPR